jgi:hypothetical protein
VSAIDVVLVGAGNRGRAVFGAYALRHPERMRVVAVAEPHAERRAALAAQHGLAAERVSRTGALVAARARTRHRRDRRTARRRARALGAGYHLLLESRSRPTPATACAWSRRRSARAASCRSATCCATRRSTRACTRSP